MSFSGGKSKSFNDLLCLWTNLVNSNYETSKAGKILKGSMISIPSPSPSVKIQIMGGKVCLRCKGKTLPGVVNKPLKTNVLPYYLK